MRRRALWLLAVAAATVTGCGQDRLFGAPPPYPALDAQAFDTTDDASGLRTIAVDDLPATAVATLALVDAGGPFPRADDGSPFSDPSGALPSRAPGSYRQYSVVQPGGTADSPWHLVVGDGGEVYWTEDGFETFRRVVD